MSEIWANVEQAIQGYSPETRAALLRVLTYRAAVIGRLFEGDRGHQTRELLIDLEEDEVGRGSCGRGSSEDLGNLVGGQSRRHEPP